MLDDLELSPWKYLIILGIGITGLTTYATTYNAIAASKNEPCPLSEELQKKYQTRFIVTIVLSIVAIILGILLAYFFRTNSYAFLTLGLTTAGIFGLSYALISKFAQGVSLPVQTGISWGAFIIFVIAGFMIDHYEAKNV